MTINIIEKTSTLSMSHHRIVAAAPKRMVLKLQEKQNKLFFLQFHTLKPTREREYSPSTSIHWIYECISMGTKPFRITLSYIIINRKLNHD